MQYLDQFRSKLSEVQGDRVLKRLQDEKDTGRIASLDEFRKRLKKLTSELLQENLKPTFEAILPLLGQDISSEQWNFMQQRIEDDLITAFEELDNIDDILEAHENLILNVSSKVVQDVIDSLTSKIELYEFLHDTNFGFDNAAFNTFRIAEDQDLDGTNKPDPRALPENTSIDSLGYIDTSSQYLTLSRSDKSYDVQPVRVRLLANSDSAWGSYNNEDLRFKLDNIIDGKRNTYWLRSVLSNNAISKEIEISLSMPGVVELNHITIQPASELSQKLIQIDAVSPNNIRTTVYSAETSLDKQTRINFPTISVKGLIIRLKQDNSNQVSLNLNNDNRLLDELVAGNKYSTQSPVYELEQALTSYLIKETVLGLSESNVAEYTNYYQFVFGIDNIFVGNSGYSARSISTFKDIKVSTLGLVGIKTNEKRNYIDSSQVNFDSYTYPTQSFSEDGKAYTGSIEYWAKADFYDANDALITSYTFPILPLYSKRVYRERLLLNYKSSASVSYYNVGQTQFYADADMNDIIVYRNGSELQPQADWDFSVSYSITSEQTGERMKRGIVINDITNPLDIYTISYTPKLSNTLTEPPPGHTSAIRVDMTGFGDVLLVKDNILLIKPTIKTKKVDYANIELQIILRSNTANSTYSPAVEDYLFLTASYDTNKFSDEL